MIDRKTFAEGLGVIGLQIGHPVEAPAIKAYYVALHDETEPGEWVKFCASAVKRRGWRFVPGVTELLDALREFRGEPRLDVEAADAYDRVMECRGYSPEAGATWSYRMILERCGRAAAEAFMAAGGPSAFPVTYREGERRERFLAAYQTEAREVPHNRLLPPAQPVPVMARFQLVGEIAQPAPAMTDATVLGKIETLAAEIHPQQVTPAPRKLTQAEWDLRRARLQEQAREIDGEKGA